MGRRRDIKALEKRRRRAAALFNQGHTQAEVARRLKVSRQSVMRWYNTWQQDGVDGLRSAGRLGRRPRLDDRQRALVDEALRKGPQAHGYRTELWTLPRVAKVIEKVTGVHYHSGHVWRVMRQLGWSLQRPTTRARERNEDVIQHWIKVRWPEIKKTRNA
jgi:transposase